MDEKAVDNIRISIALKSTEELKKIYQKNDRSEYTDEAFEAISRILLERNESIPTQKVIELSTIAGMTSKEHVVKQITKTNIILLVGGSINIMLWYIWGADIRTTIFDSHIEIKVLLAIALYYGLAVGILQIILGCVGFVRRSVAIILILAIVLLFVGISNIGGFLLTVVAFRQYGISIDLKELLSYSNKNAYSNIYNLIVWSVIGLAQIFWGFDNIGSFIKNRSKKIE